jgi:hypothetical protein
MTSTQLFQENVFDIAVKQLENLCGKLKSAQECLK